MNTAATPPCDPQTAATLQAQPPAGRAKRLARYLAQDEMLWREIVRVVRSDGSALVLDRNVNTLTDTRLLAQLTPDEPDENAQVVSDLYLADPEQRRCRSVTAEDFAVPSLSALAPCASSGPPPGPLLAGTHHFSVREVSVAKTSCRELRWTRAPAVDHESPFEVVTLREVVASLEAYEPALVTTRAALVSSPGAVQADSLQLELDRLLKSPTVLNRRLREEVHRHLTSGQVTMSEIARRCGRSRRDARGHIFGEASWLARRIGQVPTPPSDHPSPWIDSDVLALIARDGLGISPLDVEL